MDKKLDVCQQCTLAARKAKCILGYTGTSMDNRQIKGGDHSPSEITLGTVCPVFGLPSTGKTWPSGVSAVEEHKNTRVISGLTHLEDKERLGDCFFHP